MRRKRSSRPHKAPARTESTDRGLHATHARHAPPRPRSRHLPAAETAEPPPADPCDELIAQYVEQQVRDCVRQIRRGLVKPKDGLRQVSQRLARELSQEQFLQLIYRFHSYGETPTVVLLLDTLTAALAERQAELKHEPAPGGANGGTTTADVYVAAHYDHQPATDDPAAACHVAQQPCTWTTPTCITA